MRTPLYGSFLAMTLGACVGLMICAALYHRWWVFALGLVLLISTLFNWWRDSQEGWIGPELCLWAEREAGIHKDKRPDQPEGGH